MIKKIKLVNFRNFENKTIDSLEIENFIVGENGKGKTNILEAISLIGNNNLTKLSLENYVKIGQEYFFIEINLDSDDKLGFYYSIKDKKKNFLFNEKKISRKLFFEKSYSCVIFSPIMMNMMYLSPSLRRDFLDEILISSYEEYDKLLKDYKKIIKSRNSCLKAIKEGKAQKNEIVFWNDNFIKLSEQIYYYRFKIASFFEESIKNTIDYFSGKIQNIEFKYITKIDKENIKKSIQEYLEENFNRDIVIGKTAIGAHVDDFEINLDGINMINYASRGETKSVIIYLKLLEGIFIEKKTGKKPVLIIDDLISELDNKHKNILLEKIKYYQVFISSIEKPEKDNYIKL